MTPTTPIIYGNGTMLSDIGEVTEVESTPSRKLPGPAERRMLKQAQANSPLRSSPTVGYNALMKRTKTVSHERKLSVESTSTVTTEGQAAELFKDFDDGVSVDDSNFQGDDEESVADSYSEEVIASETQRLAKKDDNVGDEDRNSSAALSRRAEQILLNAKKRLNNMEGNLTRARSSLYINPSGSGSSIHSSSPLSRSTPSPQDNRRIVSQMGVPPTKHRQLHTSADSANGSPGHSRVYSENSIAEDLRSVPFPVRSASAAARYGGKSGMDSNQPSPPLSGGRENPREDANLSGLSSSSSKPTPPRGAHLKPLSEDEVVPEFDGDKSSVRSSMDGGYLGPSDEPRNLTRSTSSMQMRDLKDQMHDLKGRLSVLRDRARDDTMKRRSLQSLRTPSPFTAAEQWYTAAQAYTAPGLSADAGVGHSPRKEGTFPDGGNALDETDRLDGGASKELLPTYARSEVTSVYEDVMEGHHATGTLPNSHEPQILEEDESYDTAAEDEQGLEYGDEDYSDEIVNREELDDYDSDTSLYHDTQAISHEDREDAFDYEHFFLHSAMGTISQQKLGRRDSFSSEDSVETTRGPPAANSQKTDAMFPLGHLRSESTDSVSTMATFATATEGLGSDAEDEDVDNYAVQSVNATPVRSTTPGTAKRLTFGDGSPEALQQAEPEEKTRPNTAIHDPKERNGNNIHRPSVASFDSISSTGTTRSFPLINKPKSQSSTPTPNGISDSTSSRQNSIISDSTTLINSHNPTQRLQPSPVHMLAKDDQILVERVVASLGKCVLGLQESSRGSYEGRLWRRRLDAARRTLEVEEGPN